MSTVLLASLLAFGQFLVFFWAFVIFSEQIVFSSFLVYPLLTGVCWFSWVLLYSKSLQTGYAWISSSIANAYPLVTIFIATLFLWELISLIQLWFFALIFCGIFFLSFHLDEIRAMKVSKDKASLLYAVGAMIMWAWFVTFFDRSVEYYSTIVTIMIAEAWNLIVGSFLLFYSGQNIIRGVTGMSLKVWRDIGLVLVCSLFGVFFFAKAFETWSLSFVSAITACSPAITTILARIFLHEKLSSSQYAAILLLVLGISGLSYVSL